MSRSSLLRLLPLGLRALVAELGSALFGLAVFVTVMLLAGMGRGSWWRTALWVAPFAIGLCAWAVWKGRRSQSVS